MELKIWSKTLLNVYGCLQKLADEIDKIVLSYAISSGGKIGEDKTYLDTQKILELTDRKITLINTKVLIEKCLNKLDVKFCKILTLKYVDKFSGEMITNLLNIKKRTYFRKYLQAIDSFASKLQFEGYDIKKIYNLVKKEEWIMEIYNSIKQKELLKKLDTNISNFSICSRAVKDYSKQRKVEFA